ncbi:hypothetical protein AAH979_37900 [Plantactinospora sp. ZYX-F-223]|uniref:hypothetical protein n=1 Tax=Plantactinospora sp. ZYX-F-223 TaxID=3144103 RepID=UPI0031FD240E
MRYSSRYFGTSVDFTPVCEPDAGEELEISYAVCTNSPAGAAFDYAGRLTVIFDEAAVHDFASLDALIEHDAFLDWLYALPYAGAFYGNNLTDEREILDRLHRISSSVRRVENASGRLSFAFEAEEFAVGVNSAWSSLVGIMPPRLHVGALEEDVLNGIVGTFS